jgi:hypothetical protein
MKSSSRRARGRGRGRAPGERVERDMDETPFAAILATLLSRVPGAYAAALVDVEGETVDYAGVAQAFDIRVAAAHARILLAELAALAALGAPRWLVVRGEKKTIAARALPEGYALALLLRRRAGFTTSGRAFSACERDLEREAGWKRTARAAHDPEWHPVEVEADRLGRPRRIGKTAVKVIGEVVGLAHGENGYRVRTTEGNEVTVVREARNCWYADQRLDGAGGALPNAEEGTIRVRPTHEK